MAAKNTQGVSQQSKKTIHNTDIVNLIIEDHKALKRLIATLKNSDLEFEERKVAFEDFAPLLVSHAKPEEETLYKFMKATEELREQAFEGDVEHTLADQMLEEIKRTDDSEMWSAKVKVLAELVEHHIEEEESDLLPEFKKHSESGEREELGNMFLQQKTVLLMKGGEDSPPENTQTLN